MVRLYFLLSDVKSASGVANELRALGIADNHIHLLSRNAQDAQDAHILSANPFHVSDAWHMTKYGSVAGMVLGVLVALLTAPDILTTIQAAAIGVVSGASIGSIIGIGRNETNIEEHEWDIEEGRQMLLVDVDKTQQDTVIENIRSHHTNVEIETSHGHLHF